MLGLPDGKCLLVTLCCLMFFFLDDNNSFVTYLAEEIGLNV